MGHHDHHNNGVKVDQQINQLNSCSSLLQERKLVTEGRHSHIAVVIVNYIKEYWFVRVGPFKIPRYVL
jgi:hypothetical protein